MSKNHFNAEACVSELATVLKDLLGGRPVALLDWPNHANSGDHFIWLGEKVLLRQLANLEISYECPTHDVDFERLCSLPPDAAFVFHGGGNFGDLYEHNQRLREGVIAAFPDRRIVLMPQTVHYESEAGLRRSASVLRQHRDLHVMARDRESLRILQEKMELARCYLTIDAAFGLQPIVDALVDASPPVRERDAVYLTRRDGESLGGAPGADGELQFDWAGAAELSEFTQIDIQTIECARGVFDGEFDAYSWERLCKAIQLFKAGRRIVTDRLHGHILATMMGKPHRLYDNSYGKNGAFFRSWTHACDLVTFIPSRSLVEEPAAARPSGDEDVSTKPSPTFNGTSLGKAEPKISLVLCSRNRATQLAAMLGKLDLEDLTRNAVEVNIIDSASTDSTYEVMREFKKKSGFPINIGQADRAGLALARNIGIKLSSGEIIVFTDDDCYIDANYFTNLSMLWDGRSFQYGGGQIVEFDASLDPRVATLKIGQREDIPPNSILAPGSIQGANMFFAREVFQRAGLFNENMGLGTPFACEDIEMATRASMRGFRGVLLRELRVLHDHGRKRGSPEADRTVEDYDYGRGAYYASLIVAGYRQASELPAMAKLPREMDGAQRYLDFVAKNLGARKAPAAPRRNKISGLVISYNRADVIETCLRSLRFVDELIVVDKSSDDGAAEIARQYADKVIVVPWSPVVEDTRAQALDLCSHEFIVCLDDDECLSPEAIKFISRETENPTADIYRLPVRSYILGRFDERRADWPDHKDKFFRRGSIGFSAAVHVGPDTRSSKIQVIPPESPIFIHHFSVPAVSNWIEKVNRYTSQPLRVGWVDPLPLSIDLPRQSIDHWLRKGHQPDDYLTAFVLSRMVYDVVDKLKRWETETGADGKAQVLNLCKVLQSEYDEIEQSLGVSRGRLQRQG